MSEVALGNTLHQLDVYIRVPRVQSTLQTSIGQRSFAFYEPTVWNSLPSAVRGSGLLVICVRAAAESFVISVSDKHHPLWRLWRRLQISRLTYLR